MIEAALFVGWVFLILLERLQAARARESYLRQRVADLEGRGRSS